MREVTKAKVCSSVDLLNNVPIPADSGVLGQLNAFVFVQVSNQGGVYVTSSQFPQNKKYNGFISFGGCIYHVFSDKYIDRHLPKNPSVVLSDIHPSGTNGGVFEMYLHHLGVGWDLGIESWLEEVTYSAPPAIASVSLAERKKLLSSKPAATGGNATALPSATVVSPATNPSNAVCLATGDGSVVVQDITLPVLSAKNGKLGLNRVIDSSHSSLVKREFGTQASTP